MYFVMAGCPELGCNMTQNNIDLVTHLLDFCDLKTVHRLLCLNKDVFKYCMNNLLPKRQQHQYDNSSKELHNQTADEWDSVERTINISLVHGNIKPLNPGPIHKGCLYTSTVDAVMEDSVSTDKIPLNKMQYTVTSNLDTEEHKTLVMSVASTACAQWIHTKNIHNKYDGSYNYTTRNCRCCFQQANGVSYIVNITEKVAGWNPMY
jgi:hypothetical protein